MALRHFAILFCWFDLPGIILEFHSLAPLGVKKALLTFETYAYANKWLLVLIE